MTPEHRVMNEVRLALGERGVPCFRCNVGRVLTAKGEWFDTGLPKGFPDLIAFGEGGRLWLIECKAPKGRLSAEQRDFAAMASSRGFDYIVARGARDVSDVR